MTKITCTDIFGTSYIFDESEYVDRSAVYGILIHDNTILLVKDTWGEKWGLPGGGIDKNESAIQALKREFIEETGIIIDVSTSEVYSDSSYFMPSNEKHPWRTLRSIYKVSATGGSIKESGNTIDVIEAKYWPLGSSRDIDLQPNTSSILEKLISGEIKI